MLAPFTATICSPVRGSTRTPTVVTRPGVQHHRPAVVDPVRPGGLRRQRPAVVGARRDPRPDARQRGQVGPSGVHPGGLADQFGIQVAADPLRLADRGVDRAEVVGVPRREGHPAAGHRGRHRAADPGQRVVQPALRRPERARRGGQRHREDLGRLDHLGHPTAELLPVIVVRVRGVTGPGLAAQRQRGVVHRVARRSGRSAERAPCLGGPVQCARVGRQRPDVVHGHRVRRRDRGRGHQIGPRPPRARRCRSAAAASACRYANATRYSRSTSPS